MYTHLRLIFITLFFLSGCITQADQQQEADKIINDLHQAIQQKQWDAATQLFNPDFFKTEPKKHWQQQFGLLQEKLGEITGFHIASKSKDPRFGGDFYIYIISVRHEHGFSHETVTLFKSLDDKPLAISGYQIKAQRNP
ncbi:MAG: hypothetical protein COB41_09080 [Proteobacteria bacterium]|nr:MAG: hypothetical protein COB41_09080 [Pseudomonadota bacterium]